MLIPLPKHHLTGGYKVSCNYRFVVLIYSILTTSALHILQLSVCCTIYNTIPTSALLHPAVVGLVQ